jgi:uncharacterized protein YpmB
MKVVLISILVVILAIAFVVLFKNDVDISREEAIHIASKDAGSFYGDMIMADLEQGLWHVYTNSGKDKLYNIDADTGKIVHKYDIFDIK